MPQTYRFWVQHLYREEQKGKSLGYVDEDLLRDAQLHGSLNHPKEGVQRVSRGYMGLGSDALRHADWLLPLQGSN